MYYAEHCGRGTCSRSLRGGYSGILTRDPSDESTIEPPLPVCRPIGQAMAAKLYMYMYSLGREEQPYREAVSIKC